MWSAMCFASSIGVNSSSLPTTTSAGTPTRDRLSV
jgi:hypothetical protein